MNERLLAATMSASASNNTEANMEAASCSHIDDTFKYNAYIFTYVLVFPVAFLCNVLALLVFFKQKKRRGKPAYIIMVNLAFSDGSFSLTLPLRLAYYMNKGKWFFPDWICRLCVFGFYVNLYSSILLLTLLSLLRWFSIVHPLRHRFMANSRPTLITCLGIWVFVGTSSLPFLSNGVTYRDGIPRCFEPSNPKSWSKILSLNYVGLVFGFLIPFFTIIFCCSKIIHCLTSSSISMDPKARHKIIKKNKRSVRLLIMVIATFLLCFLPYHLIRTLHLHAVNGNWNCQVTTILQRAVAVTLCLAASNSVVNPMLYYYSTKNFKEDVGNTRSLLSKRFSSIRGSQRSNGKGSVRRQSLPMKPSNSTKEADCGCAAESVKMNIPCCRPADSPV
ncbi:PREDICTED: cysteinyl leukotriene receptor 2-like [Cyprinodon variegatus]|uniref:Cysteinyl leukotriene receptor 2-like n=1 Tax=Cyprinodon variegatus TaxID=28743 RepID=A0A3Q2FNS7_CYPVA|nr:PREDICTED: cysteinyl leukotriene receptor 2-like [Cyprinodon variegatus]